MGVSDELNRLRERLDSRELTVEQYEEMKRRLQEESVSRGQKFWGRRAEARRWRVEMVRGTVRDIAFPGEADKATLDVDGRKVELSLSEGAILISVGDTVLLAGSIGNPVRCHLYYNETTGSGSLESARKSARQLLIVGWLCVLVGLSILTTVALAARREPAFFSTSGMFHGVLYSVSMAAGGAAVMLSFGLLCFGTVLRKRWALVQFVVSGH
jgi:hypothetical protein